MTKEQAREKGKMLCSNFFCIVHISEGNYVLSTNRFESRLVVEKWEVQRGRWKPIKQIVS